MFNAFLKTTVVEGHAGRQLLPTGPTDLSIAQV